MYKLSEDSKKSIEKATGMKMNEILVLPALDIDKKIEKKIGKKLSFRPVSDFRLIGRGSVYMALSKFIFFDYIEEKFNKLFA